MGDSSALNNNGRSILVPGISIPYSVQRRLPQILSRQLHRLLVAPESLNPGMTDRGQDLKGSIEDDTPPISEPDLHCDSHMSDYPGEDPQRPATMASCDTSFSKSTRASFHSDSPTLMDVTRIDDFMSPMIHQYEADSGVKWNRVLPALNLLRNALYEAQQTHCDDRLVRSLYTGALGYLLDALPEDLTQEEMSRIRENFPDQIEASAPQPGSYPPKLSHQSSAKRSFLHRLLASITVQLFILLQLVSPYLKASALVMYQYERSYRVTEHVLALALRVIEAMGKSGYNLGFFIFGLYDGGTMASILDMVSGWLEAVFGGVYEGVGEGMVIVGMDRPALGIHHPRR
ncbi:hypothetical protein FE257_010561 [Aspergillus nanangensis]|uniref:Uncharacterized protein n=1 Tax=Aspergillus nanangensis TaxID=2582783 RepID=A0AAD4GRY3_ASPNN|nr:hypothetical protein FE257_010561 [Aspergillus nanangensis]